MNNPYLPWLIEYKVTNGLGYSSPSLISETFGDLDSKLNEYLTLFPATYHLKSVQEVFFMYEEFFSDHLASFDKRMSLQNDRLKMFRGIEDRKYFLD